jgi:hypothetical protein
MALVNQSRLLTWLQNSNLQVTNIALYQLITQLIKITAELENITGGTSGGGGGGGVINNITNLTNQFLDYGQDANVDDSFVQILPVNSGSTPTPPTPDYVVLSDGVTPTPAPVDDGFGNFIYVVYTP